MNLDKFILCPYCSTLDTIETQLYTQNECPIFTILGSNEGGIDIQTKSTLFSHGFLDAERIELCDRFYLVSILLKYHWCRKFVISASVISARRLNRHQWNMIFLSIWFLFPCHKAISLFFSVLRPRAGRFWLMKVAKQTKENCCKKRFFMEFSVNHVMIAKVL